MKNQNSMLKKGLVVLLTILAFQSYSQTKNFIDQPYLETRAIVDTLVIPDNIYIAILISESDTKGKTSVEELENKMEVKLKSLGIDTNKQLSLSDMTSNFKNYFIKKTDVLKNKSYTLLVHDAITAGKVIVELEAIEISNVKLVKTEYSKNEELQIVMKQKAIEKAVLQAASILKPLNQQLGKAIFISDMNTHFSRSLQGKASGIRIRGYASEAVQDYTPIEIEFEKIKIESSLTIYFAID